MKKRNDWYLPSEDSLEALGPFEHDQIADMIFKGDLTIDSFIWNMSFATERWVRIMDINDFSYLHKTYPKCKFPKKRSKGASNIKKLTISYGEGKAQLARDNEYRRYPRCPFKADVLIHNQRVYSQGKAIDISEKGMYLLMDNTDVFQMGEEVHLTIINCPYIGTMSIRSVIINTRVVDGKQGYGIFFLHINPQIRRRIVEYVVDTLNGAENIIINGAKVA